MNPRRKRQAGHAMVEFALASAILLPCMTGAFQFGYTFYTYNLLESAASNGARYAALRTYRCLSSGDIDKGKTAIKNMVVFGTPSPANNAVPVAKGLTTANVDVSYKLDSLSFPLEVTVSVKNYKINAVFIQYTLNGKPLATLPYLGRYAPEENEIS